MKLSRKISMLDRIISELQSDRRDPFEHLTQRERNVLAEYNRSKTPVQLYQDVIEGDNPTVWSLELVGLSADCTELEASEAWERELASFGEWYKRRNILKGIRPNA